MTTQLTPQQLEDRTQQLENRIESLEAELTQIKQLLGQTPSQHPWWQTVFGSFADCPDFDAAEQLGREWRSTQTEEFE
jgi:hypothetical protein